MLLALEHTKTVIRDLVLPPSGLLLLGLIGLLLLRWRPLLARVALGVSLLCLWLLSLPTIAEHLERFTQRYPALDLSRPIAAQAIVILGGGVDRADAPEYGGPAAGPYLIDRLAYGAYVAHHTRLPILVTGWHVEAIAMRDSLQRNFGITPRWVDDQAYDTFGNARNSTRLLHADGVQRVLLVTDTLHMWRAVHEFTAAGLSVVPAPALVVGRVHRANQLPVLDYLPDAQALQRSCDSIYELLGEQVRVFLAATHLRRQQRLGPVPGPP
jgi:uncharacterized SAM-binding protein YcdF (DUF218 family)